MRVRQLIELLKGYDPEMLVAAEGCDCVEAAVGLSVEEAEHIELNARVVVVRREGGCYGRSPISRPS